MTLPRANCRLAWTSAGEGATYRLRVATESLDLLAAVPDLETTEHVVPESSLADLPPGAWIVWQVEATLPDGSRIVSPSYKNRLD